jgi:putative DNA methylase
VTTDATRPERPQRAGTGGRTRVLIEDWLPAAAIGVECMRERGSASALAPHTYLHVWWARRPLTAARAAVLGSLLPADFPRDVFERLLGFGRASNELVRIRRLMDAGLRIPGGFGVKRAFTRGLRGVDLDKAHAAIASLWGLDAAVIDPMAGGGSIPLEAARLGLKSLANEYNAVACSILEATTDYPFLYGPELAERARYWGREWLRRIEPRLEAFFPKRKDGLVHAYIYARTIPCPETGHQTPLVPDWSLLKPKSGLGVVAEPVVDKEAGTWSARIRELGAGRGHVREMPTPTYKKGKGVSLFTRTVIPAEYIKAKAQAGQMGSRLYAVAVKSPQGLRFEPPDPNDLEAIEAAANELGKHRASWEQDNVIPTELYPELSSDPRPRAYGMLGWADMFSARQLLGAGVLVEELRGLRSAIVAKEGKDRAGAIEHLLAFGVDKFLNYNSVLASWHAPRSVIRSVFDRHDFAFKFTFAEMAPCSAGSGMAWALDNVLDSWTKLASLPRATVSSPVVTTLGSATSLPGVGDRTLAAVVVDPPYDDNVQYSELADFFYVWLKRAQGHRHPDWFATYLCDHDEEAVVNLSRFRTAQMTAAAARDAARSHYRELMTGTFRECHRILQDDGVLTVMFTHKKQEAWEALFTALIRSGFTITATWPVKTESEHSLHQAKKNAAQSTVFLVARKRDPEAGTGYFDKSMQAEIRARAESAADRLQKEGLNAVDQLVGSFGPALEVYSRYAEVRTDTGDEVGVDRAIDIASDAVSNWRIQQLAARGLQGVEAEGRFALLCWDVLGAAEFRFNEAKLLGHAVGMDVSQLAAAGLVSRSSDKIKILSATDRRRSKAVEDVDDAGKGGKVHPNDVAFRTALDGCHALTLRYVDAGGGAAGIGAARSLARQQGWDKDSPVARLVAALVQAAPEGVRIERGKASAAARFPEFRAWHGLLFPLFGVPAPDWTEKVPDQFELDLTDADEDDCDADGESAPDDGAADDDEEEQEDEE